MAQLEDMIREELSNARENGYCMVRQSVREIALDLIECTGEYTEYSMFQLEKAIRNVQAESDR